MTIQTIVQQVLQSRILTRFEENTIDTLLQTQTYSESDLQALEALIEALSDRSVVTQ